MGLAVHVAVATAVLAAHEWNPQYFVHFGRDNAAVPVARSVLGAVLTPHPDGHDGQAFWVLARDPLLRDADLLCSVLDRPVYRAQRIAFPVLASAWRIGGEPALIWGLLATNLLVVLFGGVIAGRLAVAAGAPARASLAFALCPGVLLATVIDLADGLAVAGLIGVVSALSARRTGLAVAAGVVAVLAKESMLLGLAGIAAFAPALVRRTRWLVVGGPFAAAFAWGVYVRWRLGWGPTTVTELDLPFRGFVEAWRRGWSPLANWTDALTGVALLPLAWIGTRRWLQDRSLLLSAAVPFLWLVPFFSANVLDYSINSLRAVSPSMTLMVLHAYATGRIGR